MLNNPKWLLFYFLFFGFSACIGWMLNGVFAPNNLSSPGVIETIKNAVLYDYDWINGNLQAIKWILVSMQLIFGMLIGYELFSGIFGRR